MQKNDQPNMEFDDLLEKKSANKILKNWDYPGTSYLEEEIRSYKEEGDGSYDLKEARSILKSIVLWKVNRQVFMSDELLQRIVEFEEKNIETFPDSADDAWWVSVKDTINEMTSCEGVRIAMASTILHFYHPDSFLIIDKRAFRVVMKREMPDYISNPGELYVSYLRECIAYYKRNKELGVFDFDFKLLDRFTYQLDIEAGNKVSY